MRKQILVVKHPEGWAVKRPGAERASFVTSTQAESISQGRRMSQAEGAELTIQGRNGQFRAADSHGHDTFPPIQVSDVCMYGMHVHVVGCDWAGCRLGLAT